MRFFITSLLLIGSVSCVPTKPNLQASTVSPINLTKTKKSAPASSIDKPSEPKPELEPKTKVATSSPFHAPSLRKQEIAGITIEGVFFDSRSAQLIVVDQAGGPGSQFPDAAAVGQAIKGLAAINAGFFTPEGTPLGLVVAGGKCAGSWNSASSLGSGIWSRNQAGNSTIARREKLGNSSARHMQELIQAGPLLIENHQTVAGLEASKSSIRTFIATDGGTRWCIGQSSPCTLAALSLALGSKQAADWPIQHALNLDGGRSSEFWVSEKISGGPFIRRPLWNRPVRNFLVLVSH